jgi:uncharacterized protein (DUF697 family)/GTPase Era involved in 16S rRNA processing
MAIDKLRARELIGSINSTFDATAGGLPKPARDWLRQKVFGPAIGEIEELVLRARPPVLYLLGRSGHGKSSLLNALARREVAEVGHVRPQTPGADPYFIAFEEVFAEWQVVDSRGIFETPTRAGSGIDPVAQAQEDIRRYRPDVMLHVVAASEARALAQDFRVFAEIQRGIVRDTGAAVPTVMVLTKPDLLGDPDAWPPREHPRKAAQVKELLDYVAEEVLDGRPERIDPNATLSGYRLAAREYVGIIPVSALPARQWNVETLADFVGRHLPQSALLDYAQALQRRELLRRVATSMTRRFSAAASGIGATPIPVADITVLTPLQGLLVAFIAGLSCRQFSWQAATEFTAATGFNVGFAVAAREVARGAVKLVPGFGSPLSGAIAGATTYGIGRSAEAYFFAGEARSPRRVVGEWLRRSKGAARAEEGSGGAA